MAAVEDQRRNFKERIDCLQMYSNSELNERFRLDYDGIVASQVDILNEIERFYKSLYSCYGDNLKEVELNSIISSEYYSR